LIIRGKTYGIRLTWEKGTADFSPTPVFPIVSVGTGSFTRRFSGDAVMLDDWYVRDRAVNDRKDL
jgi:hypothetical protein